MILKYFLNRRAAVSVKSFLLPVACALGLILGLGINQIFQEKSNISLKPVPEINRESESFRSRSFGSAAKKRYRASLPTRNAEGSEVFMPDPVPQRDNQARDLVRAPSANNRPLGADKSLSRLKDYIKSVEEKNIFLKDKFDHLTSLLDGKE
ncbi:MAG: hypothetical protein ABIF89_01395, partial [bacterium]